MPIDFYKLFLKKLLTCTNLICIMWSKELIKLNRLKELRLEKNLKQSEIANIFGCTQQMISKYEKGYTHLPCMIEDLASNYFDCSIDYLKGLTEIRNPSKSIMLTSEFKKARNNKRRTILIQ